MENPLLKNPLLKNPLLKNPMLRNPLLHQTAGDFFRFVTAGFLYNRNFIHFIAAAEIDDAPGVYHFNGLTG
jgi:hypothetical protein